MYQELSLKCFRNKRRLQYTLLYLQCIVGKIAPEIIIVNILSLLVLGCLALQNTHVLSIFMT